MAELFFGEFRFDTKLLTLEGPDGLVEVRAKTLELLTYLIEHRNRFVSRKELLKILWPNVTVTESSLTQCVSELRQALSDSAREPKFIETRVKQGYHFKETVYHRPTERLEPVPPPPSWGNTSIPPPAVAHRSLRTMTVIALLILVSAVGWWMMKGQTKTPSLCIRSLSQSEENEGFATEIERSLSTSLAQTDAFDIRSKTSTGQKQCSHLIEIRLSTLHKLRTKVTVTLIDNTSGSQLWGWSWLFPVAEVESPALADEIADTVAEKVRKLLS